MPIISYEDMKEKKRKILNALIDIASVVDELNVFGLAINGEALLDLKNKLESDNFKVLVIGEFKNGKSTFINSLMGKKVLPAYSTPCTAVINEVVYGKAERAMLYFKNPLPEEMSTDIEPRAMQYIKKYEGKEIPPIIRYLGRVLPPAVIGMLVIYCLKNVSVLAAPFGLPEFIAVAAVIMLHVWKRNNLLSIGAGTALYMFLIQVVF